MNADASGSRPPRWFRGKKFTLSTGMPGVKKNPDVHTLVTVRSVYMAPLGAPVLPDVYMIIAKRSSLPSV
jgi:hypothetical protein